MQLERIRQTLSKTNAKKLLAKDGQAADCSCRGPTVIQRTHRSVLLKFAEHADAQ
jgi:hypothetical protein